MCTTCGCDDHAPRRIDGTESHSHGHGHPPDPAQTHPHPDPGETRSVSVEADLLARNDAHARENRRRFDECGVRALNLVSSPGSGKTALLVATLEHLSGEVPLAVIEGDQETHRDADRIRATGVSAVQINTGKGCHLDAHGVGHACDRLDLPEGGINYVPGRGSEIGDTLTGDGRLDAIAMTGSSGAGKHIARNSGMVELHLELGGNAPAIIFPDADLADAAGACAKGSAKLAGQRCTAVSRVLAHEDVHDDLVERLDLAMESWQPGDLFDEETSVGPLISEEQAEWVQELVDDAVEKGAELVRGGTHDGPEFESTVLANVPHDARIIHEEQFG
ncbi:MAG: hydrogenase nickel incorporation protein HypB, partial [Ectothiorhodospira sp.]